MNDFNKTINKHIKECYYCGSERVIVEEFCGIYYVMCISCKTSTKDFPDKESAIDDWNEKKLKSDE